MKRFNPRLGVSLISVLSIGLIAAGIFALVNPDINIFHIGAGGQSTGGEFTLSGSMGQHDAGGPLTGGEFTLNGGLWGGGSDVDYPVYLPLVMK